MKIRNYHSSLNQLARLGKDGLCLNQCKNVGSVTKDEVATGTILFLMQ